MPTYTAANPPPLVRPGEKTLFTPVRDWLAERVELSWPAKVLYSRLERYAGKQKCARPTQAQLARDLGMKPRSLRAYLAELRAEHAGMPLIWVHQTGDGGAARYFFPAHPWRAERVLPAPVDNFSARQNPAGLNGSARQNPATLKIGGNKERARAVGDNKKRRQHGARAGAPSARTSVATQEWAAKNLRKVHELLGTLQKSL